MVSVRDMNQANSLHSAAHSQALSSSSDYLLSICHLAHPTFPARDPSPVIINARHQDSLHHRLRLPRLNEEASTSFDFHCREEPRVINVHRGERKDLSGEVAFGCHGASDPLEYLFGHRNNLSPSTSRSGSEGRGFVEGSDMKRYMDVWEGQSRSRAYSVPHTSTPALPHQRKSSCPELPGTTHTSLSKVSPKHSLPQLQARKGPLPDKETEGDRQDPIVKHSLISQWISDCRSAWKEARGRACMLPSIAEI